MDKEQKNVTNVYAALTVSLLMSFVPVASAALFSLLLFLGVWITAYILRGKAETGSLTADHMSFIIRTIWITGLFSLITMGIATAYILNVYDPMVLINCVGPISSTDMAAIEAAVKPCIGEFMHANMPYFIKGAVIAGGPLVVYMAYRLAKGISRASKGHRVGDLKSWF